MKCVSVSERTADEPAYRQFEDYSSSDSDPDPFYGKDFSYESALQRFLQAYAVHSATIGGMPSLVT